ncbi:olfactory receptor 8H1 [Xenopus laevis]|uniref:Olfactory receptor 8H1 n=1 Tax=Xenopus laevis TaxID=8355 RepID=A0A8J0TYY9_XENLA|nr:olfactory receptor 8H1 [Xenopus laevis]
MENVSSVSRNFVLLGIVQMEELRYLYCILSLFVYIFIMLLSLEIVLVVLTEESLHEPMYIFICNLTFNGMLGSSSFFPKLIIDLLTSSHQISHTGCFLQVLGIITYAFFEIFSFTIMAYDRYLAVCDPLRYATIMTNRKAVILILGFFSYSFITVLVTVILSARLSYCGTQIKNIFCDNLSLIVLSCGDTLVNNVYGTVGTVIMLVFTLMIIAYSYLKIFMVCLKITKEACEKAIHTVVTHLLGFSIFLVGALFIFIRFRLGNNNLPLFAQILLSVTFIVFPPLLNPLIFGIRTKALRVKIFRHLHKIRVVFNQSTMK